MPHRYFTQDILGNFARITGPDAHHLARVMRAKEGDEITLCDGQGTDMTARVTDVGPEAVMLEVLDRTQSTAEPPLKVTLFVAYPKLDKLETIIQKGVELGASAIQPFTSRYCVAQPKKEEQKLERRRRIALEAAKQCGRGAVPAVEAPVEFAALPGLLAGYDRAILLYEGGGVPLRTALEGLPENGRLALITGSEGGFAPEEAEVLCKAGAVQVGLGPRILRCETAPTAVLAAVMALTGNFE